MTTKKVINNIKKILIIDIPTNLIELAILAIRTNCSVRIRSKNHLSEFLHGRKSLMSFVLILNYKYRNAIKNISKNNLFLSNEYMLKVITSYVSNIYISLNPITFINLNSMDIQSTSLSSLNNMEELVYITFHELVHLRLLFKNKGFYLMEFDVFSIDCM